MFQMIRSNLTLILLVLIALALGAAGYNYQRAEKYQERAESAENVSRGLLASVQSKDTLLKEYDAAALKLVSIAREQRNHIDILEANVHSLTDLLVVERDKLRVMEERDREIPACANLLQTDFGVCPGIVDGMRVRANRRLPGQAGANPGAVPGEAGHSTDR